MSGGKQEQPISERLEYVRDRTELSLKDFWRKLRDKGEIQITYETARRYHLQDKGPEPSVAYLSGVSAVFRYRLEWLISQEGPRTKAEEEDEERKRERLIQDLLLKDDLAEFVQSLPIDSSQTVQDQRRGAVRRFARRLSDAEFLEAPWYGIEARKQLIEAVMHFLTNVDRFFEEQEPGLDAHILRHSAARGWNAEWADAVVALFSRRVLGLGERTGGLFDSHAPASPRRRTGE